MSKQNTPWYDQSVNQFDVALIDKTGKEVLVMLNNDRMKFILKAVNNHDRLVEALEHCIQIMDELSVPEYMAETYGNAILNYSNLLTEQKS